MGSIRIIAGLLKGRTLPFNTKKFNDADITPQKVKGALFSAIGEGLDGKVFVDLFAGSGQVGFEAVSRGADLVVFNEFDKKRFRFIQETGTRFNIGERTMLLDFPWKRAVPYLHKKGIAADVVFLDPPYIKKSSDAGLYSEIIEMIGACSLLKGEGKIIVQHFRKNSLASPVGGFVLSDRKVYGSTALSFYSREQV